MPLLSSVPMFSSPHGALDPKHPVGVVAAQIGELYQVLRGTLGVGAAVDENRLTGGGGITGAMAARRMPRMRLDDEGRR